jgi:hypothetical protein
MQMNHWTPRLAFGFSIIIFACCAENSAIAAQRSTLRVSDNKRFLVHADGSPFVYLGDTAWELLHRLDRKETERYLADRAGKGFTVIQTVALAELDGLNAPNAFGHRPLVDNDPLRPDVRPGPANDYWDHVDYVVEQAESHGLFVGLLPTWGDKWNRKWGVGPEVFNEENARFYGQWLGKRYGDKRIIWILGGDRNIESPLHRRIIVAMALGIKLGCEGRQLVTYHPAGGHGSSEWFHDEEWLDFNMRQNGHAVNFAAFAATGGDYRRSPVKPVIDGEAIYEDHPIAFRPDRFGFSIAADVRRPLYWNLFSGACGHTYGHHCVWQMYSREHEPINKPLLCWQEALRQPGGAQMRHARRLLESRPFLTRIPDDSIIVSHDMTTDAIPGAGKLRVVATRDEAGTYAMIYTPAGRSFRVRQSALRTSEIRAWWYNPRTGKPHEIRKDQISPEYEFTSPDSGEYLDWVLVLDDANAGYPPPGDPLP